MERSRRARIFAWTASGLGVISLVLVGVSVGLRFSNQAIDADVIGRQNFINATVQLGQVEAALLQLLGNAALNNKDEQIHDLLTRHGITVKPTQPPAVK
ncbi:MAG TPA: hypothetical protein VKT70_11310 [Stellaceae bacterium]|nr:hypothetical protein [Stellaceae bacterium]